MGSLGSSSWRAKVRELGGFGFALNFVTGLGADMVGEEKDKRREGPWL